MDIQPHLAPLVEPSPLGLLRLQTAWPSLLSSEKVQLLSFILKKDNLGNTPNAFDPRVVLDLAINDEDPYVRYLAAPEISKPSTYDRWITPQEKAAAEARYQKAITDKDPLVRAACDVRDRGTFSFSIFSTPEAIEKFWSMDHPRRLVLIDSIRGNHGEDVAKALQYAVEKAHADGRVSLSEIYEVLQQYLSGDSLKKVVDEKEEHARYFRDGFAEFTAGKDIEALWNVIPQLPPALQRALLRSLPEDAGMSENMAAKIADKLTDDLLQWLLWRKDISIPEVRARVFLETKNDTMRAAAMSSPNFELQDSSISGLMYVPGESVEVGKEKLAKLKDIMQSCGGATLAQRQALHYLIATPEHLHSGFGPHDDLAIAQHEMAKRHSELDARQRHLENFELQLFTLAVEVAPLGNASPNEWRLKQIVQPGLVVPNDPWRTYLNFKKTVTEKTAKGILGELPTGYDDEGEGERAAADLHESPSPDTNTAVSIEASNERLAAVLAGYSRKQTWILWLLVFILLAILSNYHL